MEGIYDILHTLFSTSSNQDVLGKWQGERSNEVKQGLSGKKLRYLGVLGPRLRTERLLAGQKLPTELHSPVGLPIGAEGPEEIAISIVAELIHNQKNHVLEQMVFS